MKSDDLYRDYPHNDAHIRSYIAYQSRYVHTVRESDRVILDLVAGLLKRRAPGAGQPRLLDIGCSTGNLLRHVRRVFPTIALTGGDLSDLQLETCRKDPELEGIEFIRADLTALPPEGKYDLIVANAILYGFEQPEFERCIRSIAGALRPGGALIAFDFFHPWSQEVSLVEKSGTFPGGHPLHFRSFASTEAVLESVGFTQHHFAPFSIPIELPRPAYDTPRMESYTVPTAAGARLLFRGVIAQPWCHLVATKRG